MPKSNPKKHSSPSVENQHPNTSGPLIFYRDRKKQKTAKSASNEKYRPMRTNAKQLPFLSRKERLDKLADISNENDRNLQLILWELDCNYTLLEHQFVGVRRLAGLSENFPGKQLKLKVDETDGEEFEEALFDWTTKVLENAPIDERRGLLMGDEMGLGKTVQAVCACILRTAISQVKDQPKKPTIIVSPNDAVLAQWHETLVKAGVDGRSIFRFIAKDNKFKLKGSTYVLLNRYDLQTEARYIFGLTRRDMPRPQSMLFKKTSKQLLLILKNQYLSEQGKAKNIYRREIGDKKYETVPETINRHLAREMPKTERLFETAIIDEAHFLKNPCAYWSLATSLTGLHCERVIAMSGTPYNNGSQDIATLMSFIDPTLNSATDDWWKKATAKANAPAVVEAVSEWSKNYLVRRDKSVIEKNLPKKTITKKPVAPYPLELDVYEKYEAAFINLLQDFKHVSDGPMSLIHRTKQKRLHTMLMSVASCMRLSLIHSVCPGGGRDLTIMFSPSRRKMRKTQEKPNRCVCCNRILKKPKADEKKDGRRNDAFENLEDNDINDEDDDFIVDDDYIEYDWDSSEVEEDNGGEAKKISKTEGPNRKGEGEIVPIPSTMCRTGGQGLRHFACETCLEKLEETCSTCPRCDTLFGRLHLLSGKEELLKKKEEAKVKKEVDIKTDPEEMEIPRQVYCRHIEGGFRASAKLESIVASFEAVPKDEKVIIASFFKSSLDLLEAIFHEKNIPTCRFDGDISNEDREEELIRFKTRENCRVLLMSVQTGGTGLNVVEASQVMFVDRAFNPFVHAQCEDRVYRLGQTKDCHITYHDVSHTIDDVMRSINEAKMENASIILADGSKLNASTAGLSFKDISGVLGGSIQTVRAARVNYVKQSQDRILEPLPPSEASLWDSRSASRERGQVVSITDAIADMLGYVLPDMVRSQRGRKLEGSNVTSSTKAKPKIEGVARRNAEDGVSFNDIADDDFESDNLGGAKVSPMEVGSGGVDDRKPAAVPSRSSSGAKSHDDLAFLDDSGDDESIPDAVVFKKAT